MLSRRYKPSALIAFILLTITINGSKTMNVSCKYWESIDLTGYEQFPNRSYVHENTIIPEEFVSIYEYKIDERFQNATVNPYPRGCICKLKPCVRFCCKLNTIFNTRHCEPVDGNTRLTTKMTTTTKEGHSKEDDISSKFVILVRGFHCKNAYFLDPNESDDYNSSLFENGSILLHYDSSYAGMDEYCLSPYYSEGSYKILPVFCDSSPDPLPERNILNAVAMLISVFFMIITIAVYVGIPELRTLHGKSLCCYLLGLCVGYTIISCLILGAETSDLTCSFLGYLAYYSFMASFFWLTVMNFDIFYKMGKHRKVYKEKTSFRLYSAYSWGLAFVCLLLTYLAQNSSLIPDVWKPDIGISICFVNVERWSALIYLYGPLILITIFNSIMFVLTAKKIYQVKKDMSKIIIDNKIKPSQDSIHNAFGIFVRLFIVMGVTWSMEIFGFFVGEKFKSVNMLTIFFNGIQGLIIFCLLVMKKRIWKHITMRFYKLKTYNGTSSTKKANVLDTSKPSETLCSSTRTDMENRKKEAEPLVLEG